MLTAFVMAMFAAALQEPVPPAAAAPAAPSNEQRIAQSAGLGSLIYTFDRAAWVSTDALTAAIPKDRLTGVGGYVVEAADPKTLRVTYYTGNAATAQAFFHADVRDGKVVSKELLAQPVALTPGQTVLARAREIGAQRAVERAYKPCTPLPFNTVVLPARSDGVVAVYLLSAQQDAATYPMGGNYRVIVAADGQVLASRPYSVGCRNTPLPKLPKGATPVGIVVNHLLDPVPTELHVFASYSLRMPVYVATPDKRVWQVRGSEITLTTMK